VCDPWGRAHDHANLFLASTGVLPTAGTCNSTQTGLALALRTVEHIIAEHAGAPAAAQADGGGDGSQVAA
jgi:choline dehydrogenase-like flavoprotein